MTTYHHTTAKDILQWLGGHTPTVTRHAISTAMQTMPPADFKRLRASIKAHGLISPDITAIVDYETNAIEICDGWHRLRALAPPRPKKSDMATAIVELLRHRDIAQATLLRAVTHHTAHTPDHLSAVDMEMLLHAVCAKNLQRRHSTPAERAKAAVEAYAIAKSLDKMHKQTIAELAAVAQASESTISRAIRARRDERKNDTDDTDMFADNPNHSADTHREPEPDPMAARYAQIASRMAALLSGRFSQGAKHTLSADITELREAFSAEKLRAAQAALSHRQHHHSRSVTLASTAMRTWRDKSDEDICMHIGRAAITILLADVREHMQQTKIIEKYNAATSTTDDGHD